MASPKPHVAVFPSAGMGHLIPFAELAMRLCDRHGLSVTIITCKWMFSPRLMAAYSERIAASGFDINFVQLPEVEIEGAEHMKIETQLSKLLEKSKGSVQSALRSLVDSASPVSAFITDFFCSTMFEVAAELNIPNYVFVTSTAYMLSLMQYIPKLLLSFHVSFKDADFPIEAPGALPIPSRELPDALQDRSDEAFDWTLLHFSRLWEVRGILINTFEDLETKAIKALVEGKMIDRMPRFYPVGPLITSLPLEYNDLVEDGGVDCLKWLDNQPPSSVLFVSFGSGTALPREQVTELAAGLEASGHRFLWVLRSPSSGYLSIEVTELSQLLPDGFRSRTQDRGLVVSTWAPQIAVLSHPSTGGFISHCGWNSTLESISHGVPMICWPLFAEQTLNRFLLVNEFKMAIAVKMEGDGFVRREEVERAARELMEGEGSRRLRERARELKEKAHTALEGGSSYKAMAAVVSEWTTNAKHSAAMTPAMEEGGSSYKAMTPVVSDWTTNAKQSAAMTPNT